jgi:hypothetical protein
MDMFEYVMVLVSIIVGLAMTHLLQGLVEIAQRPKRMKIASIHLVWVIYMVITVAFWWWWQFRLQLLSPWTFQAYLFVLGYAVILYILSTLLFPKVLDPDLDLDAFFYDRRGWFFGFSTLYFVVDLIDSRMKGVEHFNGLGVEYVVTTALSAALCLGAMRIRSAPYHWAVGLSILLYQTTWAFRQFGTMG